MSPFQAFAFTNAACTATARSNKEEWLAGYARLRKEQEAAERELETAMRGQGWLHGVGCLDTTFSTSTFFCGRQKHGATFKVTPCAVHATTLIPPVVEWSDNPSAWYVSEYVFGVRTSKLTRHLGVKSLSTYSKEYVKQTRH
jgi:hypothetical protein